MIELFEMGGTLFMTLITLALLAVIGFTIFGVLNGKPNLKDKMITAGNLALALGVLGTVIGWFGAAEVIEKATAVSSQLLGGGLKVSLITLMYGLAVYCFSRLIRLFW